jgi:hypothetical protein
METIKAFDLDEKLNTIKEKLDGLSLYTNCIGEKSFDEYLSYLESEDFQKTISVIDHKKLELIKLITQL